MNKEKRKKKHLSTVRTSRLLANLVILCGFAMLLLGIVYPVLPELVSSIGLSELVNELGINLVRETTGTATEAASGSVASSVFNWSAAIRLLGFSVFAFYIGYLLKLLSALVESQVVDLHG